MQIRVPVMGGGGGAAAPVPPQAAMLAWYTNRGSVQFA